MKQSFITSYLTFYMKSQVALEENFIKTTSPNSILKVIPLGSSNKTIPLEQISSVDDSFKMDIKSFIWGVLFAIISCYMMKSSFVGGIILLLYGVLTVLSSFQSVLQFNLTSENTHSINAVVFEKSNLLSCKETIEALINQRYCDTNVTKNTDRVIDALNKK